MAELANAVERLKQVRRLLERQAGEAQSVALAGKRIKEEIRNLRQQVELCEKASLLLTGIGEQRQSTAQEQIEALVTQGLRTIFNSDLSFHLIQGVRAKTPVVDFVVRSRIGDTVVDTDLTERGGGLAATVGFLLRLVILLLSARRADSVLFLDETFTHVSADYEVRLAEFLRELVDKTGVQIILVTHSDAFNDQADVRYRFEQIGGITSARAV